MDRGRIVEEGPVWSRVCQPSIRRDNPVAGRIRPQLPEDIAARLLPGGGQEAATGWTSPGLLRTVLLLAELSKTVGLSFRLVHGGMETIQGEPIGTLFLAVGGSDTRSAQARHFLNCAALERRCSAMSPVMLELLVRSSWETILMTGPLA